jgi:hypothetical protein
MPGVFSWMQEKGRRSEAGHWQHITKETLKKSSFPRRREFRVLILLGFAFGKHDFSE